MIAVSNHADREKWGASRGPAVDAIADYLRDAGVDIDDCRVILDHGCGCGRILAGWEPRAKGRTLYGTDINQALIAFCEGAIPFAQVAHCDIRPPLPFRAGVFDLAYAASVWTHLTVETSQRWADEMERVIRQGGIMLVSFHGQHYYAKVDEVAPGASAVVSSTGFYTQRYNPAGGEGSNEYATISSAEAMERLFGRFMLLRHFEGSNRPTHFAAHQDVMVLRRL